MNTKEMPRVSANRMIDLTRAPGKQRCVPNADTQPAVPPPPKPTSGLVVAVTCPCVLQIRSVFDMRLCAPHTATAIYFTTSNGRAECLKLLLDAGSDVRTKDATSKLVVLGIWCRLRHLLMHPSLAWAEADGGQIH